MKTSYDIIIKPIISEKSMTGPQHKQYTFEVAPDANKIEIAKAVEEIFKVQVAKVNTVTVKGKPKRVGLHEGTTAKRKKAVVTLTPASKTIAFFDSLQ